MYSIGIDLGGTNIAAGVVDDAHRILASAQCKTPSACTEQELIDAMAALTLRVTEAAGLTMEEIHHIGIGAPGNCNIETGEVEHANNLGLSHIRLVPRMQERFGKPVHLENDANAAALGEYLAGAGKGSQSCICITLGTGVGGGIILDGRLYSGFNHAAGEVGCMVVAMDGLQCSCGRRGCWEMYASATALIRQTKEAMVDAPDSKLWQIAGSLENVNGRTAFDAMKAGDPTGKAVVDTYIRYVAVGLINLINIFQPEVICIGGGISNQGQALLEPLQARIETERYSRYSDKQTRICIARLGNDAGIIGAAYRAQE